MDGRPHGNGRHAFRFDAPASNGTAVSARYLHPAGSSVDVGPCGTAVRFLDSVYRWKDAVHGSVPGYYEVEVMTFVRYALLDAEYPYADGRDADSVYVSYSLGGRAVLLRDRPQR